MGRVCKGFLQCLLKLLNFLLILVGIAIIVYSLWMLNEWKSEQPGSPPSPPSPSPSPSPLPEYPVVGRSTWMIELKPAMVQEGPLLGKKLPAPWFIYAFLLVGVIVLLVTCTGHIAAETASGCCLCCYTVLLAVLLLGQAALAGVIYLDKHWERDIPDDPTGAFDKIQEFVRRNINICQWVALGVVIVEAVSLFLAILLRSVAAGSQKDYDSDDEFVGPRVRQPLLNRQQPTQGGNPTPSAPAESRPPPRSDAWSTRMREKYGLDTSEFTYNPESKRGQSHPEAAHEERRRGCVIM